MGRDVKGSTAVGATSRCESVRDGEMRAAPEASGEGGRIEAIGTDRGAGDDRPAGRERAGEIRCAPTSGAAPVTA